MSDTIELVRFRLKQGKTAADWLQANEKVSAWVQQQPGFRFRSLSETDDGEWIDLVYWQSPETARAAGERIMGEIGDAFEAIAEDSIVCTHSKAHVMQRG